MTPYQNETVLVDASEPIVISRVGSSPTVDAIVMRIVLHCTQRKVPVSMLVGGGDADDVDGSLFS